MAIIGLINAVSSAGGLFKKSPQDPFKSNPRDSGLDLLAKGNPMVWVNRKTQIITLDDGVTTYAVPPGGRILQIPGGKPNSGKLTADGGGTKALQTAASAASEASAAATVGSSVRAGAQPQPPTLANQGIVTGITNGQLAILAVLGLATVWAISRS